MSSSPWTRVPTHLLAATSRSVPGLRAYSTESGDGPVADPIQDANRRSDSDHSPISDPPQREVTQDASRGTGSPVGSAAEKVVSHLDWSDPSKLFDLQPSGRYSRRRPRRTVSDVEDGGPLRRVWAHDRTAAQKDSQKARTSPDDYTWNPADFVSDRVDGVAENPQDVKETAPEGSSTTAGSDVMTRSLKRIRVPRSEKPRSEPRISKHVTYRPWRVSMAPPWELLPSETPSSGDASNDSDKQPPASWTPSPPSVPRSMTEPASSVPQSEGPATREASATAGQESSEPIQTFSPALTTQPEPQNDPQPSSQPPRLTHLTTSGSAHMVDVGAKPSTHRVAVATGVVSFSNPSAIELIRSASNKKGDVLATARIAGIMAAKRTSEIIPLCHPIALSKISVELAIDTNRTGFGNVRVLAVAECVGPTGVEMEAMTAVSAAALTIYDMCKAVDRGMAVRRQKLIFKDGGRSGVFRKRGEIMELGAFPEFKEVLEKCRGE